VAGFFQAVDQITLRFEIIFDDENPHIKAPVSLLPAQFTLDRPASLAVMGKAPTASPGRTTR
jgi:hypothetical protein